MKAIINKQYIIQTGKDVAYDFVGSVCMAVAIKMFSAPNNIAPGGVNGIATLLNYTTGFPIGTAALMLNIPLLILAWKTLGKRFVLWTLRTLLIYTFVADILFMSPLVYQGDSILAALFGGVFIGISTGLIFMHGSTAGGADIVIKLVQKKHPHYSAGQLILVINGAVMIAAAIVYQNIEAALYGLIMTFTSGRVMDGILYGADTGKSCMIVTGKPKELAQKIIETIHRSATIIDIKGAYKDTRGWMLLCVVRRQEYYALKKLIAQVDPEAFVIVNEANQILGRGFKSIDATDN